MFSEKTKKISQKEANLATISNDYEDIKVIFSLGQKTSEGWVSYYCGFYVKDFQSGKFNCLYSSDSGSIISEAQVEDFQELNKQLQKSVQERNSIQKYTIGEDFSLIIEGKEDIFRITASIDLCTMNRERLDAGNGDSLISVSFNCSISQIESFSAELTQWLDS